MKPKLNLTDIPERDQLQTPPDALLPLLRNIRLHKHWTVWECAAGEAYLAEALHRLEYSVVSTDVLYGEEYNFFGYEPKAWDCIITNPPYSIKYHWIERCVDLGRPWALLMPLETLGAQRAQKIFEACDMELIVLNRRINFKTPNKGWNGSSAQFPVAWFTSGFGIGRQITYAEYTHE